MRIKRKLFEKCLQAPDLCLIQGPPGTGKTTVIAEAIFQFVRQGDRVLVASQSNDAVDNALERLADTPEIRAIRLGQKANVREKLKTSVQESSVRTKRLSIIIMLLSLQVSKNWLDLWDSLESDGIQYETDSRNAKYFNKDIDTLNTELAKLNEEYGFAKDSFNKLSKELEKANDSNTKIEEDKHQYRLAVDCFNGNSDSQFYLSEDMLKIFESKLNKIIDMTTKVGIYLTPGRT